jgi:hypothetical protein
MSYFSARPGDRPGRPAPARHSPGPEAQVKPAPYFGSSLGPCPDPGMLRDTPTEPSAATSPAPPPPGVYVLAAPTLSPSEALDAIDQALRRNSARVAVHGLFDLE